MATDPGYSSSGGQELPTSEVLQEPASCDLEPGSVDSNSNRFIRADNGASSHYSLRMINPSGTALTSYGDQELPPTDVSREPEQDDRVTAPIEPSLMLQSKSPMPLSLQEPANELDATSSEIGSSNGDQISGTKIKQESVSSENEPKTPSRYTCKLCPFKTTEEKEVKAHVRNVHPHEIKRTTSRSHGTPNNKTSTRAISTPNVPSAEVPTAEARTNSRTSGVRQQRDSASNVPTADVPIIPTAEVPKVLTAGARTDKETARASHQGSTAQSSTAPIDTIGTPSRQDPSNPPPLKPLKQKIYYNCSK